MHPIMYIGITDSEVAYENYPVWIKGNDPSIEVIRLRRENLDDIRKCSGILLSGGVDTHPRFYNNSRTDYPNAPEIFMEERDLFETDIFQRSREMKLPLLAICRGMQLANICLGGTLVQDLQEAGTSNHRKQKEQDGIHEITIEKDSFLYRMNQDSNKVFVNSAHHQGLDIIADGLRVTARSDDGVPEAIEATGNNNEPFFLGVQWHPERVEKQLPDDTLSKNIRQQFLYAAQKRTYANH